MDAQVRETAIEAIDALIKHIHEAGHASYCEGADSETCSCDYYRICLPLQQALWELQSWAGSTVTVVHRDGRAVRVEVPSRS